MLDSVKTQLKGTIDRKAAMILLQGLDVPLAVFKVVSPEASGELWIRNGKYLCDAKANGGLGGLPDMIRLLGVAEGEFDIEKSDEHPPDCPIVITLGEIIADEEAVVDRIRKAIAAEETAASDIASQPSAVASDEAPAAAAQPEAATATASEAAAAETAEAAKDAVPESAEMQKSLSSLFDEGADSATAADTAVAATSVAEPTPAETPVVEPTPAETAVAEAAPPPLPEEPAPVPPPLPAEPAEAPPALPAAEAPRASDDTLTLSPDMLNAALSLLESGGGKYTKQASAEEVAAAIAAAPAVSPEPAPVPAVAEAAAAAPAPAAETPAAKLGMTLDELPIDPAKLEALKNLLGDRPGDAAAAAPATTEQLETSVNYDDLNTRRQADLKALSDMLSERAENFNTKQGVAPDKWSDDLKAKRRQEYEALRDFYGEEKSDFYKESGLGDTEQKADPGLNDFQKRILEIVDEESKDPKAFREADPKLKTGGNIRPSWDDVSAPPPGPEATTAEAPPPLPPQEEYVGQAVESPYADVASSVGRTEMLKGKLQVESTDDRLDLISRPRERGGEVARAPEADFRREPINKRLIVSTVVAVIALPIVTFVVAHYFDANAQEDLAEQREAARMADRAVAEKPVAQPQEPFRMPAGGSAGPAPAGGGGGGGGEGGGDSEQPLGAEHGVYKYKAPTTQPQPMNQAEMTDANQMMQFAQETIASGNKDKAIELYNSAMRKYPRYMQLRLMVIKTMLGYGKYRTAAQFCIEGMNMAGSESDFNTLYALYKQIP